MNYVIEGLKCLGEGLVAVAIIGVLAYSLIAAIIQGIADFPSKHWFPRVSLVFWTLVVIGIVGMIVRHPR